MRKLIIASFILIVPFTLLAQRFGGTPPSVQWKQINTDSARVIFPSGMDSVAQRVANLVHYQAALPSSNKLGDQLRKINIVLQSQTTIANGYVALGPYRSEFYMNPQANGFQLGSIAWPDQLAIHEYRHVQQFNNFNKGLSKAAHILFGQEGYALAVNASVPDWFYEGDAVYNETVLSGQGRGRLPLFLNAYPALMRAGKNYSWMKLRNGSLKDYVPDRYNLGYWFVNYGHEKYGNDFWAKVTADAAAFKGLFYPFQKAVRKYAGVDYKTFRKDAFKYFKEASPSFSDEKQISVAGPSPLFRLNTKVLTNYYFPYVLSADSILYLKTANNKRPAFFIKDKNGEHRLRARDLAIDEQFSYRNGKIVYAAYETDIRWAWRDYSVIKVLDIKTNQQKTIAHKTKYITPDISADGTLIAAIALKGDGTSELHLLDAETGEVKTTINPSEIGFISDPKFITNDTLIATLRFGNGEMALGKINAATGSISRITPRSYNVVGYPNIRDGVIYFTASYGGSDNLFAIKPNDKTIYQLTDYSLGNYYANVLGNTLAWSSFTAEGFQLQRKELTTMLWKPTPALVTDSLFTIYPVTKANDLKDIISNGIPERKFAIKKYSKSTGLLNFHSWRPYYEDPIFTFSLYGENVLNTLQTEIYYLYNQNDKTNAAGVSATYGQLFPYLSVGTQMTFDRSGRSGNNIRTWNQLDTRIGFSVPLNFTGNQTYKSLNIGTDYFLRNEYNTGINKNLFVPNNFTYLHHYISWSQQIETAVQHIYPRFANSFSINERYAVTNRKGYQFHASGALYLPGILPTHSIVLTGAFIQRDTSRVLFGSAFANARGYADYYNTNAGSRMWRLSANYHFPLWLPDWGFGNILYIQRIRANAFYDYQRLYSNDKTRTLNQSSFGGEFFADTKWWNQYNLTFGIRISHLQNDDPLARIAKGGNVFEFILPVSIIPK